MTYPDFGAIVREASAEELPRLLGKLAEAQALVLARLATRTTSVRPAPPQPPQATLMTYAEAAGFLRVSKSYVEALVRQGKLPAVTLPATDKGTGEHRRERQGRVRRIRRSDLEALPIME